MSIARHVIALAMIATSFCATAAEPTAFTVAQSNRDGQPLVFASTGVLKKGDIIKIHAFNADLISMLRVAMCNQDCPSMHLVKAVPLSYLGSPASNQQIVLPEDGRVEISLDKGGGSAKSIVLFRGGQIWTVQTVGPFASYLSSDQTDGAVPAMSYTLQDSTLRARFDHRLFITVSLDGNAI